MKVRDVIKRLKPTVGNRSGCQGITASCQSYAATVICSNT